MIIEVKAAFPIEWGKEYYAVGKEEKNVYAPCIACDNTGEVEVKGERYKCPRCHGNWREKEIVSTTFAYFVEKYLLKRVEAKRPPFGLRLHFVRTDSRAKNSYSNDLQISEGYFDTMESSESFAYKKKTLSDNYAAVMAEVKRLNAEQKEKEVAAGV